MKMLLIYNAPEEIIKFFIFLLTNRINYISLINEIIKIINKLFTFCINILKIKRIKILEEICLIIKIIN